MSKTGGSPYPAQRNVLGLFVVLLSLPFSGSSFVHASFAPPTRAEQSSRKHVLLTFSDNPAFDNVSLSRIAITFQDLREPVDVFVEPSTWGRDGKNVITGLFVLVLEAVLIIILLIERRRRQNAQALLTRNFALEGVLTRLSSALADCPPEQLNTEIETGLRELIDAERVDTACWFRLHEEMSEKTYCVNLNPKTSLALIELSEMPWTGIQLLSGHPVVISTLNDFPATAHPDRRYFSEKHVRSAVLVPCGSNGSRGVLGLVCASSERSWPKILVERLAVVGNLIRDAMLRQKGQDARHASEQRFGNLFEQSPLGIALEDLDGRFLFVNPALCSMLGYSEDEMRGMNCVSFSDSQDAGLERALFREMQTGARDGYHFEKRLLRKDGTGMWARVNVSRLRFQTPGAPVVLAMAEDVSERYEAEHKLKEVKSVLHELPSRLINAQEEERQRIARELHDDIGQRLSLVMIQLEQVNQEMPVFPGSQYGEFASLLQGLDEITRDVHQLSHELHSSKLQYLGLNAALNELCKQIAQQHKIEVVREIEDSPALPPEAQLCLYRVAQEALTNVSRHSRASKARVRLAHLRDVVRLEVEDDGLGFDPSIATAGLGLASMRERLRAIHGDFKVTSGDGQGTRIMATIPYEEAMVQANVG